MHREGHIGAALLANAPLAFVLLVVGATELALGVGVVAAGGAMLPDYDMRIPGLEHRGITHTVYFVALAGVVGALGGAILGWVRSGLPGALLLGGLGLAVGVLTYGSHLAADMLTPAGIDPWNDGNTQTLDVARADSTIANYTLLGLGVGAALLAAAGGAWVHGLF